jgi:type VI secretion system protein ImpB
MAIKSGQRFIKENRAPRVHIEYELQTGGAPKKVELPFVMGVLSDLSGDNQDAKKDIEDREFVDFDMDNFDKRMAAIAPRVAMTVDNKITGQDKLGVDLTFSTMDDFSPDAIVANVDALRELRDARKQLEDLLGYVGGKSGAEALLENVLKNPALQAALSSAKQTAQSQGEGAAGDEPAA